MIASISAGTSPPGASSLFPVQAFESLRASTTTELIDHETNYRLTKMEVPLKGRSEQREDAIAFSLSTGIER